MNGTNVKNGKPLNVVGFDTETKPSFKSAQNVIALIQIAVSEKKCFLFKLNDICSGTRMKIPQPLLTFLSDKSVLKVGVAVNGDEKSIRARAPYFRANNTFVDVSVILKKRFPSFTRMGLKPLMGTLFRKRVSKRQQMSDWNKRDYSKAQKTYAALDAIAGIVLWRASLGLISLPLFPDSEILKKEDRGPWICGVCHGKEFLSKSIFQNHISGKNHKKRLALEEKKSGVEKKRRVEERADRNSTHSIVEIDRDTTTRAGSVQYMSTLMEVGPHTDASPPYLELPFLIAGLRIMARMDSSCRPLSIGLIPEKFALDGLIPEEFVIDIMKRSESRYAGTNFKIEYGSPFYGRVRFATSHILEVVGVLKTDVTTQDPDEKISAHMYTYKSAKLAIVRGWIRNPKIVFGQPICEELYGYGD